MTTTLPPSISLVTYHRIFADAQGGSHFDTVKVRQDLAAGAPPAAPFYVSGDNIATKYRFYTFQPGWIGEWHPCPARQFLAVMAGTVEMETTDGEIRRLEPGDLILLEDTKGKGHVTRNLGDGYAMFFVVPAA
jgi:quercetin dioxygenase-like cupin family protein